MRVRGASTMNDHAEGYNLATYGTYYPEVGACRYPRVDSRGRAASSIVSPATQCYYSASGGSTLRWNRPQGR